MTTFSPIPAYVLGGACVGRGLMALAYPRQEYAHVGLPLETPTPPINDRAVSSDATASPLMYFKGIRELVIGTTLVALQLQRNQDAVTTFAAIMALARFGDGTVVWLHGGDALRFKALGHWITGAGFVGWVVWRWTR
ncbi:hypothetical protein F5X68DRAFT_210202 [Plectosphaerella plurivora]|uniref:Uncharacterized protein n=1 Tax=Plectosphaerella plurivora TaxID=936078 RepID=A0A9P9A7I9_9PEZI|nr:hypothetical protein F5X68DRAFT_210202 [Plectosphaerella plurivora]